MSYFKKNIRKEATTGCDSLVVSKTGDSDWASIEMIHTGSGDSLGLINLRSQAAARDLQYFLFELLREEPE